MSKQSDGDTPENIDWDSDWKDYQGREAGSRRDPSAGNVFRLGGDAERTAADIVDERTEKLTGAWTSETGYLIGIIVIALVAAGEGYVWWSSTVSR